VECLVQPCADDKDLGGGRPAGENGERDPVVTGRAAVQRRNDRSGDRDDHDDRPKRRGGRSERKNSFVQRRRHDCRGAQGRESALAQLALGTDPEAHDADAHEAEAQLASAYALLAHDADAHEADAHDALAQEADAHEAEAHEAEAQEAEAQEAEAQEAAVHVPPSTAARQPIPSNDGSRAALDTTKLSREAFALGGCTIDAAAPALTSPTPVCGRPASPVAVAIRAPLT
jgi:hypothetical protein